MKDSLFTGYNYNLNDFAKNLRKSMTPQERKLWYDYLRYYPVKIYRQRPIDNYIADFYCSKAKLVIEIDGAQHYTEKGIEYDSIRTDILNLYGLTVIRFTNSEIDLNFKKVCSIIDKAIISKINNLSVSSQR